MAQDQFPKAREQLSMRFQPLGRVQAELVRPLLQSGRLGGQMLRQSRLIRLDGFRLAAKPRLVELDDVSQAVAELEQVGGLQLGALELALEQQADLRPKQDDVGQATFEGGELVVKVGRDAHLLRRRQDSGRGFVSVRGRSLFPHGFAVVSIVGEKERDDGIVLEGRVLQDRGCIALKTSTAPFDELVVDKGMLACYRDAFGW